MSLIGGNDALMGGGRFYETGLMGNGNDKAHRSTRSKQGSVRIGYAFKPLDLSRRANATNPVYPMSKADRAGAYALESEVVVAQVSDLCYMNQDSLSFANPGPFAFANLNGLEPPRPTGDKELDAMLLADTLQFVGVVYVDSTLPPPSGVNKIMFPVQTAGTHTMLNNCDYPIHQGERMFWTLPNVHDPSANQDGRQATANGRKQVVLEPERIFWPKHQLSQIMQSYETEGRYAAMKAQQKSMTFPVLSIRRGQIVSETFDQLMAFSALMATYFMKDTLTRPMMQELMDVTRDSKSVADSTPSVRNAIVDLVRVATMHTKGDKSLRKSIVDFLTHHRPTEALMGRYGAPLNGGRAKNPEDELAMKALRSLEAHTITDGIESSLITLFVLKMSHLVGISISGANPHNDWELQMGSLYT